MVYISPNNNFELLKAYVTTDLSPSVLETVHQQFELTAGYPDTSYKLFIQENPDYRNKSAVEIRRAETEAGQDGPFLILDDKTADTNSVLYVDRFAEEDEVEDGAAESTEVLYKLRIKTEHVHILHVNYMIANSDITEDMENVGIDHPIPADYEQQEVAESGLSVEEMQNLWLLWPVAEPGEFEESRDPELLENWSPPVDRVVRLKKEVGDSVGIEADWTVASDAEPVELPDGTKKTFPEGSVSLQARWIAGSPKWKFERAKGSL